MHDRRVNVVKVVGEGVWRLLVGIVFASGWS